MTSGFTNAGSGAIIQAVAACILENRAYLSEIDGKIGDGDHGVNMAKGFGRASDRIDGARDTLDKAMRTLSEVLLSEIGGSMGPLYGMMFSDMADVIEGKQEIDAQTYATMLRAGMEGVGSIGSAKVGDKTLMDTLEPAVQAMDDALKAGKRFDEALSSLDEAARAGRDSTIDMVAKIGRSSRLGERSRGVLDAGATSCYLILHAMGEGVRARL